MISVDEGVFGPVMMTDFPNAVDHYLESLLVTSPDPVEAVEAAVESAAARLMQVDEVGAEVPSDDLEDHELYTPNYFSVRRTEDGVRLYVDCKGEIPAPMGETMRRVLAEELGRSLTAARARPLRSGTD